MRPFLWSPGHRCLDFYTFTTVVGSAPVVAYFQGVSLPQEKSEAVDDGSNTARSAASEVCQPVFDSVICVPVMAVFLL